LGRRTRGSSVKSRTGGRKRGGGRSKQKKNHGHKNNTRKPSKGQTEDAAVLKSFRGWETRRSRTGKITVEKSKKGGA